MTSAERPSALQVADVLADVMAGGPPTVWPSGLAEHCRQATGVDGVGVTAETATALTPLAAAGDLARVGADLQLVLGEGPGHQASQTGVVVLSPDVGADPRWVQFSAQAAQAGIGAAFGLPLLVGAVQLGVLEVYCRRPGPLEPDLLTVVRVHARALIAILLLRAGPAEHGGVDGVIDEAMELTDLPPVVHQAVGMAAIQLDVALDVALVRLRAVAFTAGRPLAKVAGDVVARRLGLDDSLEGTFWRGGLYPGRPEGEDARPDHWADGTDGTRGEGHR